MINLTQKVCKHCENPFETKFKSQKFCNSECYGNSLIIKKTCEQCEIILKTDNKLKRFCNSVCHRKYRYQKYKNQLSKTRDKIIKDNLHVTVNNEKYLLDYDFEPSNLVSDILVYDLWNDQKVIIGYK